MLGLMLFGLLWLIVFYLVATPSALGADGKILNWMYELGPWELPDRVRVHGRRAVDDNALAVTSITV